MTSRQLLKSCQNVLLAILVLFVHPYLSWRFASTSWRLKSIPMTYAYPPPWRSLVCMKSSNPQTSVYTPKVQVPSSLSPQGTLSLVGAGPGDPDLLTVQALRLLQNASLVIADRLISKEILSLITCELRIANKKPGCAEEAQDEIYKWIFDAVTAGRNVVRLKIGDPFLFGRGGEEVLEFQKKIGTTVTVAPGISSSYAAPLSSGIPLTHRGMSNQVLISTGYGKESSIVDVPAFSSDRTIVLLMAVGRIEDIAKNMTSQGYPSSTPVAIIEKATTPEQRTLYGTLENIAQVAKEQEAKAPATIIVGDVVNALPLGSCVYNFNKDLMPKVLDSSEYNTSIHATNIASLSVPTKAT